LRRQVGRGQRAGCEAFGVGANQLGDTLEIRSAFSLRQRGPRALRDARRFERFRASSRVATGTSVIGLPVDGLSICIVSRRSRPTQASPTRIMKSVPMSKLSLTLVSIAHLLYWNWPHRLQAR
jgi:hypothetical protein